MATISEQLSAVEANLVRLAISKFKAGKVEAENFLKRCQAEFNAETVVINEAHQVPAGIDVVFNLDEQNQMVLMYTVPDAPAKLALVTDESPLN